MKSIQELMNLKNRVALITGGAGHIGQAMCDTLAELGCAIIILDLSQEKCTTVADRLSDQFGVESLPIAVDLSEENNIRDIPNRIRKQFDRLDILINNAALIGTSELNGWTCAFAEQSSETWRKALEINLTANFTLTQTCHDLLANCLNGSIINISSIYGVAGQDMSLYEDLDYVTPAAYSASKGGIVQWTKYLATVLAPNIRVNTISPGGILRNQAESFVERYQKRTPLNRMGTEEDLKEAVAYLASDLSAYVTGQNIIVDGGWTV